MKVTAALRRTLTVQSSINVSCRRRYSLKPALFLIFLSFAAPSFSSQRVRLVPHLCAGQTLFYRIDFSSSRKMRTESRLATPPAPATENLNVSALLQVEVIEATAGGFRLKTYYSDREPAPALPNSATTESSAASAADKVVEIAIAANGSASQIKGFDQLSPAQQFVWNDWLGRFTSSMTYPNGGVHPGQKWESAEPETAASPIASLLWSKKSEYVRDERCAASAEPPKSSGNSSSATSNSCAVVLIRATLRQKSSPKNSTPEDYKARNLKTRGTASGQNDSILYISRVSGLLVRSAEDAQQSMDVFVELADGSNQVHDSLDAKSHSEILLLSDSPQTAH